MNNEKLLKRAFSAYFKLAEEGFLQPSSIDSTVEDHNEKTYVVLRNTSGILAVYRLRNNGLLRRLKRPPKTIKEQI